jgi:hypothetical protein
VDTHDSSFAMLDIYFAILQCAINQHNIHISIMASICRSHHSTGKIRVRFPDMECIDIMFLLIFLRFGEVLGVKSHDFTHHDCDTQTTTTRTNYASDARYGSCAYDSSDPATWENQFFIMPICINPRHTSLFTKQFCSFFRIRSHAYNHPCVTTNLGSSTIDITSHRQIPSATPSRCTRSI